MGTFRLYAGSDGEAHIESIDLARTPEWSKGLATTQIAFREDPVGRFLDWHPAPRRQVVIILSGQLAIVDPGTPEFYNAAADAEYYLGLARQMGGEFFRAAPKLRLVQLLSAGYDRVDVEAARKAGVPVANNGGANAIAVAEHTLMLMLAVLKRLVRLHNDVIAGKWRGGHFAQTRAYERAGQTPALGRPGDTRPKVARPAAESDM